jgi:hypothetical protein
MVRENSPSNCPSECQTLQDSDCLAVEEIQRLFSCIKEPCRTAVILDAVSGLRVGELLRLKWGRREIRSARIERHSLRFPSGRYSLQDGSFAKTDSHESRNCRHAWEMETGSSVRQTGRLDFCESAQERNPTLLAWVAVPSARETGASESGYFCISRMAHTTAQLWNLDESQWRGPQDHPRTAAPRYLQSHSRHLHASRHACETRRASQNREADFGRRSRSKARYTNTPITTWTLMDPDSKGPMFVSLLDSWRPRRDLNPCYRRERAMS